MFLALTALAPAAAAARSAEPANRSTDALPAGALTNSPSLYLREAAHSRVRWQPWGKGAFALARKLDRPMLIEVGAMWCHWCHVMDRTTYSDPAVIRLLNTEFVPVKVDTDEQPAINAYYQDAAAYLHAAGGWPLTCFATSDGALFLALGYVPARAPSKGGSPGIGMVTILTRVATAYAAAADRSILKQRAQEVMAALRKADRFEGPPAGAAGWLRLLGGLGGSLAATYDARNGGFSFGEGARFYDFPLIEFSLSRGFYGRITDTSMALVSLKKISAGGVYDQLGGGFHRYSTDARWRVPHFEKLASDQAMALAAYVQAYAASGDSGFAATARSIVGYVNSTLLDPRTHTFYSHQDADAYRGDNGSYYTWTRGEITRILPPPQARAALAYFGFDGDPARAPDGRIVLRRALTVDQLAARLKLSRSAARKTLDDAIAALRTARARRKAPRVDEMVLIDRNALMADAYLKAAAVLDQPALRRIALDDLGYLLAHAREDNGAFYHVLSRGKPSVPGLVRDQVYMMRALADAYQATGKAAYLSDACAMARIVMSRFRDPHSGLLRNDAQRGTVIAGLAVGPDVFFDDPLPSPQASAALTLAALSELTSDPAYAAQAFKLIEPAARMVSSEDGTMFGTLGLALEQHRRGETVVAIVGALNVPRTQALLKTALRTYRPFKVVTIVDAAAPGSGLPAQVRAMLAASRHNAGPMAFVCAGRACAKPALEPDALARTMERFRPPLASALSSADTYRK